MHKQLKQPTIRYELHDDDAAVPTVYMLRVRYSKCPGYPASWGYDGGDPGERNHVDDVTIEAVEEIQIANERIKPTDPAILAAIRARFDGSEDIEAECYAAAFGERE